MKQQAIIKAIVVFTMITMAGTAFALDGADKGKKDNATATESYTQTGGQNWGNLTDDQKSKLNALRQQFTDETATARASIIAKQEEIRIFMETTSPDKAKLKALSNELTELQKQVTEKKIDLTLEAKKIAPDINMSMEFFGVGKHGMMGNGMRCGMGENGMSMKGNRMKCGMGGKGMGRMNCPAMSSHDMGYQDDTTEAHHE